MAKRKITVTVDEDLVDEAHRLGVSSLSGVVNDALAAHVDRLARLDALRDLLDTWADALGPVPADELDAARALFDDVDGTARRAAS